MPSSEKRDSHPTGWVQKLYPELPKDDADAIEAYARIQCGGDPAREISYVVTTVRRYYDPKY
jgi:hypothetical protein